jgi:hypothetical protein
MHMIQLPLITGFMICIAANVFSQDWFWQNPYPQAGWFLKWNLLADLIPSYEEKAYEKMHFHRCGLFRVLKLFR